MEELQKKYGEKFELLKNLFEKEIDEIIFDSDVDDWKSDTSVFGNKILGRSRTAIMIENGKSDVFGVYINSKIKKICY